MRCLFVWWRRCFVLPSFSTSSYLSLPYPVCRKLNSRRGYRGQSCQYRYILIEDCTLFCSSPDHIIFSSIKLKKSDDEEPPCLKPRLVSRGPSRFWQSFWCCLTWDRIWGNRIYFFTPPSTFWINFFVYTRRVNPHITLGAGWLLLLKCLLLAMVSIIFWSRSDIWLSDLFAASPPRLPWVVSDCVCSASDSWLGHWIKDYVLKRAQCSLWIYF